MDVFCGAFYAITQAIGTYFVKISNKTNHQFICF